MISATHLHAMLVHFPIALLFVGFASEIVSLVTKKEFFRQAGFFLLVLGAAGAAVAYFTGDAAGEGMEEGTLGQAIALHEAAAARAVWIILLTAAVRVALEVTNTRSTWTRLAGLVLYLASIGAIAQTGYLGGQLVFKHGAGVELGLDNKVEAQ